MERLVAADAYRAFLESKIPMARSLGFVGVAGMPDRIVGQGEAQDRIDRLEWLLLKAEPFIPVGCPDDEPELAALQAEAELIRAERAGAEVVGG